MRLYKFTHRLIPTVICVLISLVYFITGVIAAVQAIRMTSLAQFEKDAVASLTSTLVSGAAVNVLLAGSMSYHLLSKKPETGRSVLSACDDTREGKLTIRASQTTRRQVDLLVSWTIRASFIWHSNLQANTAPKRAVLSSGWTTYSLR